MTFKRIAVLLVLVLAGMTISAQDLTETFSTSDGSLTIGYPSDAQVQEFGPGIAAVADQDETFAFFIFNGLLLGSFDLTGESDPIAVLATFDINVERVGDDEPITLANGSGTSTLVNLEGIGEGYLVIVDTAVGPVFGIIAAEVGTVNDTVRDLGLAVIGSASITEIDFDLPDVDTDELVVDECAVAVADMPEGVVQFCGGVEVSLPDGWSAGFGSETVDTFVGIQTEDFSISASISVNDVGEYYNPELYFTDVVSYIAESAGHAEYDPAEHAATLVDESTLTIQLYDPTQYVELEEGEVAQAVGIVTLNRDLFVTITFTWVPSSVSEDVDVAIDTILRSVTLNDSYTGTPAFVVLDGEAVFVYDSGWTDSTYGFSFSGQESYIVNCPAEGADLTAGLVWGTDIYTDDSSVCVAAVHAGVLTTDGGTIRVNMLEGQESYTGSERNGVTTEDYGSWGGSFSVEAFTTPE